MIRVMIVEDSPTVQRVLSEMINSNPFFEVVGVVSHPSEALEKVKFLRPDVITMDFDMPGLNGAQTTRIIMEEIPTPILIVTGLSSSGYSSIQFESLKAGAVDMFSKHGLVDPQENHKFQDAFLRRLKIVSGVSVIKKFKPRGESAASPKSPLTSVSEVSKRNFKLLGLGASTGGPPALQKVLSDLPNPFPLPVVLVQHMGDEFLNGFVEWLDRNISLKVVKGTGGIPLKPGVVYVAPGGHHMMVSKTMTLELDKTPPINSCRPAVDKLFFSLAENFGKDTLGILLTGMGKDGALGLKAIHSQGGYTLIQDEETSVVFGMPGAAMEMKAYSQILPLGQIGTIIHRMVLGRG